MNGKQITNAGAVGIHQATELNPAIQGNPDLYFRSYRDRLRMLQSLTLTFILVSIYEEAIDFYIGRPGFELWEDARLTAEKR